MSKVLKRGFACTVSIISFIFMFVPEDVFKVIVLNQDFSDNKTVVLNRIIVLAVIFFATFFINLGIYIFRRKVKLNGKYYSIEIRYGDIFKQRNCKKVIPFDECFTTRIGTATADINPNSLCGQYLRKYPIDNIDVMLNNAELRPKGKSKYKSKDRYESGQILIRDDYFLMSFAKLDKDGRGQMTRKEYIECLEVLWNEIDKQYGQNDVCIPILGSGVTRIDNSELTQQELLGIMINSYKLNYKKIKKPNKLIIICKKRDGFSLNKIGE